MQLEARLRAFAAVARQGSFSLAAREIHVSQPAVSKHVASLEQQLGTQLVERRRDGARLTATGRALAEYALRAEALLANAHRALAALEDSEAGGVRIAASGIPADYLLPALLASFREQYPRIEVEVVPSTSADAVELVRRHEAELAVVGGFTVPAELESETLLEDVIVLVGAPPLGRRRLRPAELERMTWVTRREGSATRAAVETARWQLGLHEVQTLEVASWEAVKRTVEAGAGIAAISRFAVEHELAAGALELLDLPRWRLRRTISLVSAREVPLTAPAERLRDVLRGLVSPHPARDDAVPELERRAAQLAVFQDSFEAGAADHVCELGRPELDRLVELGVLERSGRRYSLGRKREGRVSEKLYRRHAEFFASLAAEAAQPLSRTWQVEWSERLGDERENVRSAVAWAAANGEWELVIRLLGPPWMVWLALGYPPEWRQQLERALVEVEDPRLRLLALPTLGWIAWEDKSLDEAAAYATQRVELGLGAGEHGSVGGGLNLLAIVARAQGDHDRSRTLFEQAIAHDRLSGDDQHVLSHLLNFSDLLMEVGDLEAADEALDEATHIARARGDEQALTAVAERSAHAALLHDQPSRALELLLTGIPAQRLTEQGKGWGFLDLLGSAAVLAAQPGAGAQILARAERARAHHRAERPAGLAAPRERALAAAREALGDEEFDRACSLGEQLTPDAAIDLARTLFM
jgi:molybdate transport repressor ModE-like protein